MPKRESILAGAIFGKLTFVEDVPKEHYRESREAKFRCYCGSEFTARVSLVKSGNTKSCGCLQLAKVSGNKYRLTHGQTDSAEHDTWIGMKKRCLNPKNHKYPRYGGRGIKICERWLSSFDNFLADMGQRPSPDHSIDRINNDGPYSPQNCRWATRKEQAANKSTTRFLSLGGCRLQLSVWLNMLRVSRTSFYARVRNGESGEDAIMNLALNNRLQPTL